MKNIINCLLLCGILSACHLLETKEGSNVTTGQPAPERELVIAERSKENDNFAEALAAAESGNNNNLNATKLSYKGKTLILNEKSRCQRLCYGAINDDIMDIIAKNKVVSNKTNSTAEKNECPINTYEGIGTFKQKIQISVAYCQGDTSATIISIINPGAEVDCNCD